MAGSETMADVIRTWQADAAPNSTDQIPSGRFLTGGELFGTEQYDNEIGEVKN